MNKRQEKRVRKLDNLIIKKQIKDESGQSEDETDDEFQPPSKSFFGGTKLTLTDSSRAQSIVSSLVSKLSKNQPEKKEKKKPLKIKKEEPIPSPPTQPQPPSDLRAKMSLREKIV